MESEPQLPPHNGVDPDPSVVMSEGEGEHRPHKSVLKKVKDKAKKIKDTIKIKKNGHGHEHDHEHDHERLQDIHQEGYVEEDEEEDDDDEEDTVDDPELHGAPTENKIDPGVVEAPQIKTGRGVGLEEDPPSRHNNSAAQTEVADPTGDGGKEADVAPLVSQFDNLNIPKVCDKKPEPEQSSYRDTHVQLAPTETQFGADSDIPGKPVSNPKTEHTPNQNTITEKISSATYAAAGAAVSAKNAVALKLGYGGDPKEGHDHSTEQSARAPQQVPTKTQFGADSDIPGKPVSNPKTEHAPTQNTITGKISSATSAASGAAVSAKNAVTSKLGYGSGPHEGQDHSTEQSASSACPVAEGQQLSSGGTVKEYLAEKLRPGDEDKALSEVITEKFTRKKERAVVEGSGVKESEEVAARLGPAPEKKREGEDALVAGAESSGQGVVDRLKDAVGAWLGKGAGLQTAQDSIKGTNLGDPILATNQVEKGEEASGRQRA